MRRAMVLAATAGLAAIGVVALPAPFAAADASDGTLTVFVARDFVGSGVYDASLDVPQQGIEVTVTDAAGHTVNGTTDGSGQVLVPPSATLVGGRYKVTAAIPSSLPYLEPAPASTAANHFSSFTSFVDVSGGTNQSITLGVWNPADYTQPNVPVAVPVQSSTGTGLGTAPQAMVTTGYGQRGDITNNSSTFVATQTQIGTTMGVAYQKDTQRLFAAAYAKRHTAYGPGGPGAIYVMNAAPDASPTLFATVPDAGSTAHDIANLKVDGNFFDVPGRQSLGGMAMSEDNSTLLVVNLADNKLYTYDATGSTGTLLSQVAIPDPSCAASADWHAGAVAVHDGVTYVGGICSGESTGNRSDMKVVVYTYDGTSFHQIVSHPLDFVRGNAYVVGSNADINSHWNTWLTSWDTSKMSLGFQWARPQPMLTSIALEADGSLVLGFRDRFGDQAGYNGFTPDGTALVSVNSGGDLNRVCRSGSTYNWEGTGGCPDNDTGTAGGGASNNSAVEYYPGDFFPGAHYETAQGGVALPLSQQRLVSTQMDPTQVIYTGGLGWYDRSTGNGPGNSAANGLQVINFTAGFGKANGLGDIALLADLAPVQVGNRVWFDTNHNGVQDPGEPGVAGAKVDIYDGSTASGTSLGQLTTDASGEYYFGAGNGGVTLTPGNQYTVKFDACDVDLTTLPGSPIGIAYTEPNVGSDRSVDSNAAATASGACTATATFTAPTDPGAVDHTIDAGLIAAFALHGWIWDDKSTGDGTNQSGEPGISGITVGLYHCDGTPVEIDGTPVTTTTGPTPDGVTAPPGTGGTGYYEFANLPQGCYQVGFTPPDGMGVNSPAPGTVSGPDVNVFLPPVPPSSEAFSPETTVGPDNPNPPVSGAVEERNALGDFVWVDANGNGVQDGGAAEPGVNGVTVHLLDCSGNPVNKPGTSTPYTEVTRTINTGGASGETAPANSDGQGYYLFTGLPDGCYQVKFDLAPGELPAPYENYAVTGQHAAGSTTANDSDADVTTYLSGSTTLGPELRLDRTIDAGITPNRIGDFVWFDANGNGIQDGPNATPAEPGINGVTMILLDCNDNPVLDGDGQPITTTTGPAPAGETPANSDGNGYYQFVGIPDGCYHVKIDTSTLPAPYDDGNHGVTVPGKGDDSTKDSNPDLATGITGDITVGSDKRVDETIDAGIAVRNQLGDFVWVDANNNGVQDGGAAEPGVNGVTVHLLDCSGNPVNKPGTSTPYTEVTRTINTGGASGETAPANSDGQGYYLFTGLPDGCYQVKFDLAPGQVPAPYENYGVTTPTAAGSTTANDSDASLTTLTSADVTLGPDNRVDRTIDAGITPNRIGDYVWFDANGNGIQDEGEKGINGVTVTLLDCDDNPVLDGDGQPVTTTTGPAPDGEDPANSDGNGYYQFAGIPDGCYHVKIDTATLPAPYDDGNHGLTTPGQGDNTANDSDPDVGTGITGDITVGPGQRIDQTVDAGIAVRNQLGDYVWADLNADGVQDEGEPGINGVTVHLLDCTGNPVNKPGTTTPYTTVTGKAPASDLNPANSDGNGYYRFTGLLDGCYQVKFDLGSSQLPAQYRNWSVTVQHAQGTTPADDSDANVTAFTTGTVDLGPSKRMDLTLDAGLVANRLGDYVWFDKNSDGIQQSGEPGINGVTVNLLDCNNLPVKDQDGKPLTTTTGPAPDGQVPANSDGNGYYQFTGLADGCYRVQFDTAALPEPYQSGFGLTSALQDDEVANDSNPNPATGITGDVVLGTDNRSDQTVDAGIVAVNQIGDYVWSDTNRDGIQSPGETGVNGVTVRLLDCHDQPVTQPGTGRPYVVVTGPAPPGRTPSNGDGNGYYLFTGIPGGCYHVKFDLPSNMKFTVSGAGSDRATDSDPNPGTGITGDIVVGTDRHVDLTVDAGLVRPTPTSLPNTGFATVSTGLLGLILLVLGGGLVLISRRRRV